MNTGSHHAAAQVDLIRMLTESRELPGVVRLPRFAMNMLLDRIAELTPRSVTTVEELDALPAGSVVMSEAGLTWAKDSYLDDPEFPFWVTPGESRQHNAHRVSLPAKVLHEGVRA
ncbi:hypothetical protein ACIPWF_00680 [Paenarthrobacter sp. NPDC089989]|uniref:hypothetical protein n=1 Tax=unclassified Paenarthrobacter TaxID=2634190 RepID=UPI0037FA50A0